MIDIKALDIAEKAKGRNVAQNYSSLEFEEISNEIIKLSDKEKIKLRNECRSYLGEDNSSLILNFIIGRINILLKPHEYSMRLNNLLLSFYEADNSDVTKYIGYLILSCGESAKALRVLGDISAREEREEDKWNYYERLIKADSGESEIIIKVADYYEDKGETKTAMGYYQRALTRLIKTDNDNATIQVFNKLLENGKSETSFYLSFLSSLSEKKPALSEKLYSILFSVIKEKETDEDNAERTRNLNFLIEILRKQLAINPYDLNTRNALKDVLSEKYEGFPRLKECHKKHDVTSSEDPVKTLDAFEKNILYSVGNYVIQKATGRVGLIADIAQNNVTVKYSSQDIQKTKLETAFEIFKPITKQHIKAIKKGVKPERIKEKIMAEGGISWLVKTLLYSASPASITLKDMKNEVVPQILTESEWKQIVDKIKKILKNDPYIRTIPLTTDCYQLMDYPSNEEEKAHFVFMKSPTFYDKYSAFLDALKDKNIDNSSETIIDMISYFEEKLSRTTSALSERIASLLILEHLREIGFGVSYEVSFENLYSNIKDSKKGEIIESLQSSDLKKQFIEHIIDYEGDEASNTLIQLFPFFITSYIPQKLKTLQDGSGYSILLKRVVENYRESVASLIYFAVDNIPSEKDLLKAGLDSDKLFKSELMALSYTSKIASEKKSLEILRKDLLDDGKIERSIDLSEDNLKEILSLIVHNNGLSGAEKNRYKELVYKKDPSLARESVEKKESVDPNKTTKAISGFLCTEESKEKKQAEVKDINERQIPDILSEINSARELGDLSENSEYIYAKEHKRELDRRLAELNSEINSVRVMKKEDVVEGLIGFGTRVKLFDKVKNTEVVYSFFGRWESAPENNVIDINAPIGQLLFNHKEGDEVREKINDIDYDFKVLKIDILDF